VPIQVTYELTALGTELTVRLRNLITWIDEHTCDIFVSLVTSAAHEDDVRRLRCRGNDDRQAQVDKLLKPSPAYRPTGYLLSPPTPRRWSPAMVTSSSTSPSTLFSTASLRGQPGGK
jgi:hypothetical protein